MTISSTATKIAYAVDGVTDEFAVPFPFDTSADLKLVLTDTDGNPVVVTTGFSVSGGGGSTGTVTFDTAPDDATYDTLTISDELEITQTADYADNDAFPAETHEKALDRQTRISKRLNNKIDRCVILPDGDPLVDGGMPIPSLENRKGYYWFWNATTGQLEPAASVGATTISQSIIAALLYPQTQAEISAGVTPTNYAYFQRDGVNAKRFGVVGNGSTDDYTALQMALDSGENIYLPPTANYYKITGELVPSFAGQMIYGDGYLSQIRQTTANLNIFAGASLARLRFYDLHLYCVGSFSSVYNGGGINLSGCDAFDVRGCFVQNHRGSGLQFRDCNDGIALFNEFRNSTVAANELHSAAADDIKLFHASSRNLIGWNRCLSGQGVGIMVQTIDSGDNADDNIIAHNTVKNCIGYGIALYRYNLADTIKRTQLIGNNISNITGSMEEDPTTNKLWGAGYYVQGAEDTVIDGGAIRDVCQDTDTDQLAPGAIGVANSNGISIDNILIDTSGYYGITLRDANAQGVATAWASIGSGVRIKNTALAAVHVYKRGRVRCRATVEGSGDAGFYAPNTTPQREGFDLDMQIEDCTTNGINIAYAKKVKIRGAVSGCTGSNVAIDNADAVDIDVTSTDSDINGLTIGSAVTNVKVHDSEISGNVYGIVSDAPYRLANNRVHDNSTADFGGAYGLVRTLDNTGTPSVAYGEDFVTGGTTTITAFDDGVPGQEITVRCAHSLTFDVTSTTLFGGTTDLACASGDMLKWRTEDGTNWRLLGFVDASVDNSGGA